jgi:hypothetical protein
MLKIKLKQNIIELSDIDYIKTLLLNRKYHSEMFFWTWITTKIYKALLLYHTFSKNQLIRMRT